MPNILIDANIFLSLYNVVSVKKWLTALQELKGDVFVSAQVVAEVERNKLNVAQQFLIEHFGKLRVPKIGMPDLLTLKLEDAEAELPARLKKLHEEVASMNEALGGAVSRRLREVSQGEDEVSKALAPLFLGAPDATPEQLGRARARRERGNPPGKPDDPLGDQITWEQFLEQLDPAQDTWVISSDGDYSSPVDGDFVLHPPLYRDLRGRTKATVYVFGTLAPALAKLKEVAPKKVSATPQEIKDIEADEKAARISRPFGPPLEWFALEHRCPICRGPLTGGTASPSQFGGWTYKHHCPSCRRSFDFGEPYDD